MSYDVKPSEKKNWSASRTRICARFIQFLFEKTVAAQDPSKLDGLMQNMTRKLVGSLVLDVEPSPS